MSDGVRDTAREPMEPRLPLEKASPLRTSPNLAARWQPAYHGGAPSEAETPVTDIVEEPADDGEAYDESADAEWPGAQAEGPDLYAARAIAGPAYPEHAAERTAERSYSELVAGQDQVEPAASATGGNVEYSDGYADESHADESHADESHADDSQADESHADENEADDPGGRDQDAAWDVDGRDIDAGRLYTHTSYGDSGSDERHGADARIESASHPTPGPRFNTPLQPTTSVRLADLLGPEDDSASVGSRRVQPAGATALKTRRSPNGRKLVLVAIALLLGFAGAAVIAARTQAFTVAPTSESGEPATELASPPLIAANPGVPSLVPARPGVTPPLSTGPGITPTPLSGPGVTQMPPLSGPGATPVPLSGPGVTPTPLSGPLAAGAPAPAVRPAPALTPRPAVQSGARQAAVRPATPARRPHTATPAEPVEPFSSDESSDEEFFEGDDEYYYESAPDQVRSSDASGGLLGGLLGGVGGLGGVLN